VPLDDELKQAETVEQLREALRRSQAAERKARHRTDEMVAAVYQAAKDAALSLAPLRFERPAKQIGAGPEVALIHATDWQLGKKTADYDIRTCQARIRKFADKVCEITDIQRKHHPVDEAVLMLGGDMVEGTSIFAAQAWEVEANLFEQLFETVNTISALVWKLASHFRKLRIVCEYGNHGRIGKFGEGPRADNVDRMAYEIVRKQWVDLDWQLSDDWYQHFTIGKYRVLLVHGDEIRSFSGTPLFAIIKRVTAWGAGVVPTFDDCYMGHWHNPLSVTLGNGNRAFITGSPESGNVYAQEHLAAQARPSQRLHFIDPAKGRVTSEHVIWL
jgi:hypothetical protein